MPDNESISDSPPQPASHAVGNDNTVHLSLPATVDHYDLAALLNPLLGSHQHGVCLDVGRVSRLGVLLLVQYRRAPGNSRQAGGNLIFDRDLSSRREF